MADFSSGRFYGGGGGGGLPVACEKSHSKHRDKAQKFPIDTAKSMEQSK